MKAFVMVAVWGLVACGKPEEPARMQRAAVTGVVIASARPATLSAPVTVNRLERYERIVRNVEDCQLEGNQIVETCPGVQQLAASFSTVSVETQAEVGRAMLGDASAAVRVKAAELVLAAGRTPDALATIADATRRESHAGVLRAMLRMIDDDGARNPKVGAALLAAVDHQDRSVRLQAIEALGTARNRGIPGAAGKLAARAQHDPDPRVRRSACEHAGTLGSDTLIPVYEQLTESADDPELYAACMEGLVRMFHRHPVFDTASERAYRLFLRRLEAKPRSEHAPPWKVMSTFCYFSHESDLDKLAAWKQRASWFDPAEVKRVMADVIADKDASWMARKAAVESMVGLGATKAELEALQKGLGTGDRPVLDKLATALVSFR